MRSKADETLVIVETLICPLQISHLTEIKFAFTATFRAQKKLTYQYLDEYKLQYLFISTKNNEYRKKMLYI